MKVLKLLLVAAEHPVRCWLQEEGDRGGGERRWIWVSSQRRAAALSDLFLRASESFIVIMESGRSEVGVWLLV